jgi:hypothetical protein
VLEAYDIYTSRALDREFLELTSLFMLGNEIVEVLIKRGGILPLENIYENYKSITGKNLDPTIFGFDNLENLMKKLDLFVNIIGKKKSIALRSIHNQLAQRVNQNRDRVEQEIVESEYATADENNSVEGAGATSNIHSNNVKPDIIGETNFATESRKGILERRQEQEDLNQQTSSTKVGSLTKGSSRKLKLTSFVNTNTKTWQGRGEGSKYKMDIKHEKDKAQSEDLTLNAPGDIITIEESMIE